MKLIVPMAGRGSRFAASEATLPKPLIEVRERPMVAWALDGLADVARTSTIFVALREHEEAFGVTKTLRETIDPNAEVILIDEVTEGQLCTVLAARELIDTDEDVLISSSDTYVASNLDKAIAARSDRTRGLISVARMPGEQWSFARLDDEGWVVEVAEKRRISDLASTGLYYFSSGHELVATADDMIARREKTRGEYYVMPVYQKLIDRGLGIRVSVADAVWDMGTPVALAAFEAHLSNARGDITP